MSDSQNKDNFSSTEDLMARLVKNEESLLAAKKKIEKAEADRKIVLDNLNVGLVYLNTDYRVEWESLKVFAHVMGDETYQEGELCYKTVFNRDQPCDNCPLTKIFESKSKKYHSFERNGYILEVTANPVFNDNNEIKGGVLKLEDITERIKQENKIAHLNSLMDAILNNIPVYLYVKDPNDDFKYQYWNRALANSTQISATEVLGRKDEDIF